MNSLRIIPFWLKVFLRRRGSQEAGEAGEEPQRRLHGERRGEHRAEPTEEDEDHGAREAAQVIQA